MDVINKLYSSVSSTVSSVLPGNPVTREYEVVEDVGSAGIGLQWKIYKGYKKTTNQEVSVFVFEKKQLERWSKDDRDTMCDILKRGVQQLTKIRHPHVLTVQHPLEESRESLAFAAEPVVFSLANVLSCGSSSTNSGSRPKKLKDFELHEVEIKKGLLQIAEGLRFLHSDMKLVHRNLCPESIIINKQGSWKIFGFDFSIVGKPNEYGIYSWRYLEYNSTMHALTQPYLEYSAPEIALTSENTPASDKFAFGVLIYAIFSEGKPIKLFGKDYNSFRRFAYELKDGKYPSLHCIPKGLLDFVRGLLLIDSANRSKLHQLPKIAYFEDVGVKTLNDLASIYQWDNLQKSVFYKSLTQIIPTFPHRINLQHIIPCLIQEFINPAMVPFVLPNVLLIAENCNKDDFVEQILPSLKPVMKIQDPIQILLIFMKKMDLLLKLTPTEDIKSNVLPMLYRALESNVPQMQELCLGILPTFSSMLDYHATKNALLPRIKKLCLNSPTISVKVNALICIGKMLDNFDKWLVLDEIIPFLSQIDSREPAVLMAIIGIYKITMTNSKLGITKEVMATKIIPFLMPLCIDNGLNVTQFNTIINLVKEMVNRVESEHRKKLEQLSTINRDVSIESITQNTAEDIFKVSNSASAKPLSEIPTPKPTPAPVAKVEAKPQTQKPKPMPDLFQSNINQMRSNPASNFPADMQLANRNNNMISPPSNANLLPKPTGPQFNNSFMSNMQTPNPWASSNTSSLNNAAFIMNNANNNNNGMSSLSLLDPLLGSRKPGVPMNQMKKDTNVINTPLLQPQNPKAEHTGNHINLLSQQDILDFLN
ncbi:unnamed protein product [Hermetia illucens]|uniref:Protein kinase domain-containing protein n=1 Tax=Hermetia illucens TaxID=343691 RepID=A0A7R8V668_HERIL|nr:SCY1-like protein 2 [Hermetia illucens]CAD7092835.1 unnamed protein product [Hermetia illucens]